MKTPILLAAALALSPITASAQDNARNLAAACAICHGTQGKPAPGAPLIPLAGLPSEIAKGYNDAQIDAMAAWFAAQPR
jgi:cytochrome subunit of sulfide dehydrogenase